MYVSCPLPCVLCHTSAQLPRFWEPDRRASVQTPALALAPASAGPPPPVRQGLSAPPHGVAVHVHHFGESHTDLGKALKAAYPWVTLPGSRMVDLPGIPIPYHSARRLCSWYSEPVALGFQVCRGPFIPNRRRRRFPFSVPSVRAPQCARRIQYLQRELGPSPSP